jgi:hypothetical protein
MLDSAPGTTDWDEVFAGDERGFTEVERMDGGSWET